MKRIKITLTVSLDAVTSEGLESSLQGIRLTQNGSVVIPVSNGAYVINNPAPCGTWEMIDE